MILKKKKKNRVLIHLTPDWFLGMNKHRLSIFENVPYVKNQHILFIKIYPLRIYIHLEKNQHVFFSFFKNEKMLCQFISCVTLAAFMITAPHSVISIRAVKWRSSSNFIILSSFTFLINDLLSQRYNSHKKGQIKLVSFPIFSSFQSELVIYQKMTLIFFSV